VEWLFAFHPSISSPLFPPLSVLIRSLTTLLHSSTSTPGAFLEYIFPSTSLSVSLFGSIGPNNAPYAVFLNDIPMGNFTAQRSREQTKVMLFHADGLGSGSSGSGSGGTDDFVLRVFHTGPIAGESIGSHSDDSTRRRRQQQQQQPQILAIDFAQVTKLDSTNTPKSAGGGPVTQSGPFPIGTSPPSSTDGAKKGKVMLSTGTIVGIALSVLAVIVLLIVLLVVRRLLFCRPSILSHSFSPHIRFAFPC
jgi:hypothetical protein